jgi:hypothetical protein
VQRQVVAAELVDPAPAQAGRTQILRVAVQLETACELPAQAFVEYWERYTSPTGVNAQTWVQDPPCAPQTGVMVRTIPIRADATEVVLNDDLTKTELIRYAQAPAAACANPSPRVPMGSPCTEDCDCSDFACLDWTDAAGAHAACGQPCEFDDQCPSGQLCGVAWSDALPPGCIAATFDVCTTHADCPPGHACELGPAGFNECTDLRLKNQNGAACSCDAECPPGLLCAIGWAPGQLPTINGPSGSASSCRVPCRDYLGSFDCAGIPGAPYCLDGVCGATE